LARWLRRLSPIRLVQVSEILAVSLRHKLIDLVHGRMIFKFLVDEISDPCYQADEVKAVVKLCQKLRARFRFELPPFLICLENLWENHRRHTAFIKFLTPIFLEIFADPSFSVAGDFQVFADIVDLIVSQDYSFDYPRLLGFFVQMHDHAVPFADRDEQAATVFASFLTKSESALHELQFDAELLKNMHRCLKQIARGNKPALRDVERTYASNPALAGRLKALLKAAQRPEFQ